MQQLRVSIKDVLAHEFDAFVALEFSLHAELGAVQPHINRILASMPDYHEPLFQVAVRRGPAAGGPDDPPTPRRQSLDAARAHATGRSLHMLA